MARKYRDLYERLVASTTLEVPDNPQSCWLWTGHHRHGYGSLAVRIAGGGHETNPHTISAHRAMLEEVLDAQFPFDEAGHLCHNPLCINPDHLEVQTKIFNLGERRGYRSTKDGSMIPVLFQREAALEAFLDRVMDGV